MNILEARHGGHDDGEEPKRFPIHGTLMWTAYLVLFPLGTLLIRTSPATARPSRQAPTPSKIRSTSPFSKLSFSSLSWNSINPFTRHWVPQAIATVLSLTGATIGWSHTHFSRPKSLHTILGSVISFCLVIQVFLGWRHHVTFLKVRQRTWMARVHSWLGRSILVAAWTNLLLGMSHHHHEIFGISAIFLAAGVILLWAVGLSFWIWAWGSGERLRLEKEIDVDGEEGVGLTATNGNAPSRVGDEYFSLEGISDDDGDDSGDETKEVRKGRKSGEVTSRGVV